MKQIAIFASGSGSNAENLVKFFKNHPSISVSIILTNNKKAKVLDRAERLGVKSVVFNRADFSKSDVVLNTYLKEIDYVVLAGFLWMVPESLVRAFPNRIINIHPALLPKYGGKGMYGMHVHNAVVSNKEQESGITIHYVNEHYDEGEVIFQAKTQVLSTDTPEDVAGKIHELEYEYFPKIVEQEILAAQ